MFAIEMRDGEGSCTKYARHSEDKFDCSSCCSSFFFIAGSVASRRRVCLGGSVVVGCRHRRRVVSSASLLALISIRLAGVVDIVDVALVVDHLRRSLDWGRIPCPSVACDDVLGPVGGSVVLA